MPEIAYIDPRPVRRAFTLDGILDDAQGWAQDQVNAWATQQKDDLQARAQSVASGAAGAAGAAIAKAVGDRMILVAGALVLAPALAVLVWQLAKRWRA